jgi:hypothetical protein
MLEDKLSGEERIRLEALNQAVNSSTSKGLATEQILQRAKLFAQFIGNE